jgi:hypothetical protein
VNGRYGLASTPEERVAIATVAAIRSYFGQNPEGVMPGYGFLKEYLKPFLDRELLEARLDELHKRVGAIAKREREIAESLAASIQRCVELIGPHT